MGKVGKTVRLQGVPAKEVIPVRREVRPVQAMPPLQISGLKIRPGEVSGKVIADLGWIDEIIIRLICPLHRLPVHRIRQLIVQHQVDGFFTDQCLPYRQGHIVADRGDIHLLKGCLSHGCGGGPLPETTGKNGVPVGDDYRPGGDRKGDDQHRSQQRLSEKSPGAVDGGPGLRFRLRGQNSLPQLFLQLRRGRAVFH